MKQKILLAFKIAHVVYLCNIFLNLLFFQHLISLLSSSNLDVILSVLNLLYVFSKRSNFLSRLSDVQRLPLLKRLSYLAEVGSKYLV